MYIISIRCDKGNKKYLGAYITKNGEATFSFGDFDKSKVFESADGAVQFWHKNRKNVMREKWFNVKSVTLEEVSLNPIANLKYH